MEPIRFKQIKHLINSRYIVLEVYDWTSQLKVFEEFNVLSEAYDDYEVYDVGTSGSSLRISVRQ